MKFVPNTKRSQSLVYNGYIYMKAKNNQDGSIRWVCQNLCIKGAAPCNISCTTLNGGFQRHPPMFHLNLDRSLIHEPSTLGHKKALEFLTILKTKLLALRIRIR